MKRSIGFAFLTLAALSLIQIFSPRLQAQGRNRDNQPRNGICFYMDENYRGDYFCVDSNESQRSVEDRNNDKISSIRIFGGAEVTVYEDSNFNGSRQTISQDVPNLGAWNDRISSFQSASGRQFGGSPREQPGIRGGDNEPNDGACFYMDANYRGEYFCVNSNESQRNIGDRYNDRISSIRVFGRAEVTVYEDSNFNGSRQTISQDLSNLGAWNDRISSFQSASSRQFGGPPREQPGVRGRNNEPNDGACFYRDTNYRGEYFCVSIHESQRSIGDRYNDRISSIRVFGRAEVTVYNDSNFNGSRQTFSQNAPYLQNMSGRIRSFQVTDGQQYGRQRRDQPNDRGVRNGACFYMNDGYHGDSFCLNVGESQSNVEDRFNDRISSIRIFGRAQVIVYEHNNFGGARKTFTSNVVNLEGIFNDIITSIEVR